MLEEKVLNTITKYNLIKPNDKIVIGVSGGPDSITLLNVLNNLKEKLNIQIYVAHINHMIRKEADEETEYVKEFCKKINVECFCKKVDVQKEAKKQKIGTEEAGRNIRYAFFYEVAKKVDASKIATAHNSNDNAETVLMNIIRGTSVSGLTGIDAQRGMIIRPLIEIERSEIEEYCQTENLSPKIDKSNYENVYTRNKIRNILIPFIKTEFNPNIIDGINRLSSLATEEEQFVNKIVETEFEKLKINVDNNCVKDLKNGNNKIIEKLQGKNNKSENSIKEQRIPKKSITNLAKLQIEVDADSEKKYTNDNTIILNLKEFNKLEDIIKSKLILYTINKISNKNNGIEKIHIHDIIKLCKNNIGNKYLSPRKGIKVLIKKGKIFFTSEPNLP